MIAAWLRTRGTSWATGAVRPAPASTPRRSGTSRRSGSTMDGAGGRVLATGIDVSWAETAAIAGVEELRHDVARDEPPAGPFDLVHARLVLVHAAERETALRTMVRALRPGGWLLVEDADPALQPLICPDEYGPGRELANRLRTGFRQLLRQRGADLA
ncbi:methyltransferase [Streptomyces viridochromogenes DSM 40736]|uniref:Methyltransferase n=1 Tax=Streptomyces viridochromogenes (strain DSM 40736 / JCM 4977 / BCRC 1201 / Tue 494) TaxID=591159 RepID=D9XDB3_STRVT|nr:methyltransferase [Streptomyces viridochromogenes DSM 40736]